MQVAVKPEIDKMILQKSQENNAVIMQCNHNLLSLPN